MNNTHVTCVMDSGSNSTILSKGACDALGLNIAINAEKTSFSNANGSATAYEGFAENVVLSFHPLMEFDVQRLKVSNNPQFLILLGNDLLDENSQYRFDGIEKGTNYGTLTFYNKQHDCYIKCKA